MGDSRGGAGRVWWGLREHRATIGGQPDATWCSRISAGAGLAAAVASPPGRADQERPPR